MLCGQILEINLGDNTEIISDSDRIVKNTLTMDNMGIFSIISNTDHDFSGKKLRYDAKKQFYRLRIWDKRVKYTKDNIRKNYYALGRLRNQLGLPENVAEQAAYIYRKSLEANIFQSHSRTLVIYAAVYAACRLNNIPRTVSDIVEISGISRRALTKTYRKLIESLNLKPIPLDPIKLIMRFNDPEIKENIKRRAVQLTQKAKEKSLLNGLSPQSVAGAMTYLAFLDLNVFVPQKRLSKKVGISEVTLRNVAYDIQKKLINS